MSVHNHPPYRPVCNERLVDGQLRGACLNDDGSERMSRTDESGRDGLRSGLEALALSLDRGDSIDRGIAADLRALLAENPPTPAEEPAEVAHHYPQGSDEGTAYSRGWHNGYDAGWDAARRASRDAAARGPR